MQREFSPIFRIGLGVLGMFVMLGALSGCSNEFLTSYRGERFAPTENPQLVLVHPSTSGLIGTSNFVSGSGYGQSEALAAARDVGADFVQWSRGLDAGNRPAGAGVVSASLTPTGSMSSWSPSQPGSFLYRYVARYYKSGVKDSGAATESNAQMPIDATQVIEDDQAATQKASGR